MSKSLGDILRTVEEKTHNLHKFCDVSLLSHCHLYIILNNFDNINCNLIFFFSLVRTLLSLLLLQKRKLWRKGLKKPMRNKIL